MKNTENNPSPEVKSAWDLMFSFLASIIVRRECLWLIITQSKISGYSRLNQWRQLLNGGVTRKTMPPNITTVEINWNKNLKVWHMSKYLLQYLSQIRILILMESKWSQYIVEMHPLLPPCFILNPSLSSRKGSWSQSLNNEFLSQGLPLNHSIYTREQKLRKKKFREQCMAQEINSLHGIHASHIGVLIWAPVLLLIQFPNTGPGETIDNGPHAWTSAIYVKGTDENSGFSLAQP